MYICIFHCQLLYVILIVVLAIVVVVIVLLPFVIFSEAGPRGRPRPPWRGRRTWRSGNSCTMLYYSILYYTILHYNIT